MLAGQGGLALARQDWARALGIYHQAVVLATQVKRLARLPGLYHELPRCRRCE